MSRTPPPSNPASPIAPTATTTDADDLSTLCLYCHLRPPIYTCPGCFARTCSVSCVKLHKKYKQCSGTRDPTAYVKRSKLMTESGINRDFNFLTSLDRAVGLQLEKEEERRKGLKGEDGEEIAEGRRAVRRKDEFGRLCKDRGTTVRWAPWEGFERAKENRTAFTRRGKISWTVDWVLCEASDQRVREHNIGEQKGVIQAIRDSPVLPPDWRTCKKIKFYLVLQAPANKKVCTPIGKTESLKTALRFQTVLEYPDILLSMNETPDGWEVVENRKIVELEEAPAEDAAGEEDGKKTKRGGRGKRKAGMEDAVEEVVQTADQKPLEKGKEPGNAVAGPLVQEIPTEQPAAGAPVDTAVEEPAAKKVRME